MSHWSDLPLRLNGVPLTDDDKLDVVALRQTLAGIDDPTEKALFMEVIQEYLSQAPSARPAVASQFWEMGSATLKHLSEGEVDSAVFNTKAPTVGGWFRNLVERRNLNAAATRSQHTGKGAWDENYSSAVPESDDPHYYTSLRESAPAPMDDDTPSGTLDKSLTTGSDEFPALERVQVQPGWAEEGQKARYMELWSIFRENRETAAKDSVAAKRSSQVETPAAPVPSSAQVVSEPEASIPQVSPQVWPVSSVPGSWAAIAASPLPTPTLEPTALPQTSDPEEPQTAEEPQTEAPVNAQSVQPWSMSDTTGTWAAKAGAASGITDDPIAQADSAAPATAVGRKMGTKRLVLKSPR